MLEVRLCHIQFAPCTLVVVALLLGLAWQRVATHADDHDGAAGTPGAVTEHDVLPILLLRCTACHGRRRQQGELDLRTRESLLKGGKSGPAIVPGKPDESLLLKRIHAGEMPPHHKPLSRRRCTTGVV